MGEKTGIRVAKLYLAAVILFLPFYKQNNYFDMTYAKAKFLWITGGTLLFVYLGIRLKNICRDRRKQIHCLGKKGISAFGRKLSGLDIAVLLFAISVWCSLIASRHRSAAFWGNAGWFMGCLTIMILTGTYFILKKYSIDSRFLLGLSAVSVGILGIWGMFHSFHVDIGNLHEGISNDFYDYIMTIGNVNWYVGLLSMIFPMSCMLYFSAEQRAPRTLAVLYTDIIYYHLIICRSNGIFLGVLGGGMALCMYVLTYKKAIRKLLGLILHFSLVSGFVWGILHFYSGQFVEIDSIFFFFIERKIWLASGIIAAVILAFSDFTADRRKWENGKLFRWVKKYRWQLFFLILIAGMGMLLIYEAYSFRDSWGTKRGALWIYSVKIWQKYKWKYKIFGCGCDCFGIVFGSVYGSYANYDAYLNAHNEFLQYLVTTGLAGMLSYGFIWVMVIRNFIIQKKKSKIMWVLFSGLLGYLGQSLVNNPQALNYAVLFLLLALYSRETAWKNVVHKSQNGF